ncbi:penicillin-binding protein 1B [Colwellia hornerae]|uniref:penicillin-binding protein 1B n=1 Tax=Colwellia hornerae TaxID=89402 RepID=UPI00168023E0|nr:penicillin-binding protein 1B [Colwellia hornerae]
MKKESKEKIATRASWISWCWHTALKLFITFMFVFSFYAVYLDSKVKDKFEGQRWNIPVQVYGKVDSFKIGDNASLAQLKKNLRLTGYQSKPQVLNPGEFTFSKTTLIVYRRAFDFGNGNTHAERFTINITGNKILSLFNEQGAIESFSFEPYLLGRLVPENKEDRVIVSLQTVPEQLIDTLLLVEDRDFYFHAGVSPLGIFRALVANIRAGRTVQGGSTLTQQLVKNMFLTRDKTLWRKVNEAVMSIILELRYSKDQLLEAYINEVYLGQHYANGIYGFGLAAKFYFGQPIQSLTIEQMAMLVGQVKGPSYYDPWRHPKNAKKRRDLVLRLMYQNELISQKNYQAAVVSPLSIRETRRLVNKKFPAYLQLVKKELAEKLSAFQQQAGVRVFTGFSIRAQMNAEQTIAKHIPELEILNKGESLQLAMVVTDIKSGEVTALVGDKKSGYAGFNRALDAKRPIGSLVKPAIYLAALERYQQYNFATLLSDEPIVLVSDGGKEWRPNNYNGKFEGKVSLHDALVRSLNVPTVNLGMQLGLENIAKIFHLLGYPEDIVTRPSMLLGSLSLSPFEINQLYLSIANQGFKSNSHAIDRIVSAQGETLWQFEAPDEQLFSTQAMYLLDHALSQVTEVGTAKSLTWRLDGAAVAGKTGTTNDQRDSWFIGYDNENLVTTWLGRDDNKPTNLTGSSGALVLFAQFMNKNGVVNKSRLIPENIALTNFESSSGIAVSIECAEMISYPAITTGLLIEPHCLGKKAAEKKKKQSWFEQLFTD